MAKSTEPIYEGKAKQLLPGPAPDEFILRFKDSATAFNAKKKAEIAGKGELNQKIAARLFEYLSGKGIRTHFIRTLNSREMLVRKVSIVPIEVVIRNLAAGSICRRLGIPEKTRFEPPVLELFYKNDALDDPLINDEHVRAMRLATKNEIEKIKSLSMVINELLKHYFESIGIVLADFKLEFGRLEDGEIILADEVTPDGCRLWDSRTMNILDKDRFRKDMGGLAEAYEEVWKRMEGGLR